MSRNEGSQWPNLFMVKMFLVYLSRIFKEMLSKSFLTFDFKVFCLTNKKRNYIKYIVKRQKDEELNSNLKLVRSVQLNMSFVIIYNEFCWCSDAQCCMLWVFQKMSALFCSPSFHAHPELPLSLSLCSKKNQSKQWN